MGKAARLGISGAEAAINRTPKRRYVDPILLYELTADASQTSVGAVLAQTDEYGCRPVAYVSTNLNPVEPRYSTHERELSTIIYVLHTRRPYLYCSKFEIMTDHHPGKYLDTQKTLSRKQASWVEFNQELDYSIDYIKWK